MTSVNDIPQDQDFQGDAASATEMVIAINLDNQVADIKNKLNELNAAISLFLRDDDTPADKSVPARALDDTATEIFQGTNFEMVRLVSDADLPLTGGATIDTLAVLDGDRVLAAAQTDPTENGIYLVDTGGAWSRATDMATGDTLDGTNFVYVETGVDYVRSRWQLLAGDGLTVGTDELPFVQSGPAAGAIGLVHATTTGRDATDSHPATAVSYDNTTSGLTATELQALGDELAASVAALASGKITGPAAATDNAFARFDATTGKLVQNSQTTEDDSGNLSFAGNANFASGKGVQFNGGDVLFQFANPDNPWTPTGNGVTYTTAIAVDGQTNKVHVGRVDVAFPVTSDTGTAQVLGLPFAPEANVFRGFGGYLVQNSYTGHVYVKALSSPDRFEFLPIGSAVPLTNAQLSGKSLRFTYLCPEA